MVMTGSSITGFSTALVVLGTSTSIPDSTTCAVIMKMMSNTSTTSTNGVTLISDIAAEPWKRRRPPPPFPPPLTLMATSVSEASFGQVHELEREVVHLGAHLLNRVAEHVEEDGGGNGGDQAHGGRDQRFRDAWPDRFQAGAAHPTQVFKRADDAEHRAQQSDERRGAGG